MTDEQATSEAILAIDCGSTVTRVFLLDRVEGEYRLIACGQAPSTFELPWNDVMASVRQAVDQVSEVTGWRFLDEQGHELNPERDGPGVGTVVITTSASEPLRLVLTGITRAGLDCAQRALPASCVTIEAIVSSDRRYGDVLCDDFGAQVSMFQELVPDAIVMVGGEDGGASEPLLQSARAVAWAYSALPALRDTRPTVLFAGNADLRTRVGKILDTDVEFRAVDNLRPGPGMENPGPLQAAIEQLHRQYKMQRLPGFGTLGKWSAAPVLPAATAFFHTLQYLAREGRVNVLGVDVGGATTTVATVVDGQLDLSVHRDLGLSHNAARILDCESVESVLRWLPFEMEPIDAHNALHNQSLWYRTLPQTRQDLLLEQAVAREILRFALAGIAARWPDGGARLHGDHPVEFQLIVGSGGVLANTPEYGQAALILLDALQPVGTSVLALDRVGLAASLGAIARVNPLASVQVLERDALLQLGTLIAPVGTADEGDMALTYELEYEDGRSLAAKVPFGSLKVIPLPVGQVANLELQPSRQFDVGLGARGQTRVIQAEGGVVGIIIDARGRPVRMAEDPDEQRQKVMRWLQEVGS